MIKISIIVPCYNEEKVLSAFYRETTAAVKDITDAGMRVYICGRRKP